MSAKLIRPLTIGASGFGITHAMLTFSSVAEPAAGETACVSGTTYAIGDVRIVAGTVHRTYRRLTAGAGTISPESDAANWLDIGPTLRWAMFDKVVGTVTTTSAANLVVSVAPGVGVNSLTLLGLVGNQATVTVKDTPGGTIAYNSGPISLLFTDEIIDWYTYFFEPIKTKKALTLTNLPPYPLGEVTITITPLSGQAACGTCYLGNAFDLGQALYGAAVGIIDYSTKTVAADGSVTVTQGAYRDRAAVNLKLPGSRVDLVKRTLAEHRATPVMYVLADGVYEALTVFGFFKDFSVVISYPRQSTCALEIEGLT